MHGHTQVPPYTNDIQLARKHLAVALDEDAARAQYLKEQIADLQRQLQSVQQSWLEKSRVVQTLDVMIELPSRTWPYPYPDAGQQHQAGPSTSALGY